ncbi:circadian clock KaiB family protein [Phenylobacterium sp. J367]|uniref:circadian clock KaiB family protein n=1 Tax=Phenylobacterium sp. J367 TaxID=2898435 RepID=UPI002151FC49|nr:circadian clock KaiB family protein [Phenylobacterium sp. J367]MCR5879206.1 hypothetical protein [Phenylobacterium sp. J367]
MSRGSTDRPFFHLHLFIAGETPGAERALAQRARLIEALGPGVAIEIVDILQSPAKAEAAGVIATPTLSDESRTPPRRIVGDLSDAAKVIEFFSLPRRSTSA